MKRFALLSLFFLLSALTYAEEKVLYAFQGGTDGSQPNGGLVQDQAGNLYGTTYYGGDLSCAPGQGCGTVFKLSPDGKGGWTETVLYRFKGGADGQNPFAGLSLDSQGNLYGTAIGIVGGCPPACGTVFELSPSGSGWKFTLLHKFKKLTDGTYPAGPLTSDGAGNLYGTTDGSGPKGAGTTFRLSNSGKGWKFKVLHAFDTNDPSKGWDPEGSLVLGRDGTLYGIAAWGGLSNADAGVFYKLFPNSKGNWVEKVLYSFKGGKDGKQPMGLSSDRNGNLYGASPTRAWGKVFRFSQNTSGKWAKKTIYTFGQPRGRGPSFPTGGVLVDSAGNVYGTAGGGAHGDGSLYELSLQQDGKYLESLLYSFQAGSDGLDPQGPPIIDTNGNLYAVTAAGGGTGCSGTGCGTVFEFTPTN
jgi:uncharacterized repeat protein (TIGR03803 family)